MVLGHWVVESVELLSYSVFWAYSRPLVCDGMTALGPSVCYNYCNISSNVGGLILAALKMQHVTTALHECVCVVGT